MAITKTTVYSSAWTSFRNVIRDNITDPKNRPHYKNRIIRSHTPKPAAGSSNQDHPGFPFIVLNPVSVQQSDRAFKGTSSNLTYGIVIEVYGKDNPADVDALADQVLSAIMSNTNSLRTDGINHVTLESSPVGQVLLDGGESWLRSFTFSFKTRLDLDG